MTNLYEQLDLMIPNPICELNYSKDYELLIATMLSAQSTDKIVNQVTKQLFIYSLEELDKIDIEKIKKIITPVGTFNKKAKFIKEITCSLINEQNGIVPNDRLYLESLPGIGRKTANVVLSNIYGVPTFAVDTHVKRVVNKLELVKSEDVEKIEKLLMDKIPKNKWNRVNDQLVLFGRYICKAKKPDCNNCLFKCKNHEGN